MWSEPSQPESAAAKSDNLVPVNEFSKTLIPPEGSAEDIGSRRAMDVPPSVVVGTSSGSAFPDGPASVPSAFGRYEVRRPLGEGGFGSVYLGHDTQLNRAVAIKVLRARSAPSASDEDQFLREARKLAQLRHPGIVSVHDVGVHEGRVYVVSDFLDGVDLARWLSEYRASWPEAVRIVAAVADALAHAHARLIIHRDVKPANIIILSADRTPVLVDFGLALDEDKAGGGEKGVISGTPWYMSPEQAGGAGHRIDGRMDIYSLGAVLYEMLTGRLPFRATTFGELMRQVREDQPQPPRQLVHDIPPALERACLKSLAKRQEDRHATAGDFAQDLRLIPAGATPSSFQSNIVSAVSSRQRAREAERRQVTVVVCGCDLFESDAYLQLDAEDQAQLLRAFQKACERPVREFNGTIVQCNEQGLVACFGYPVAYEDAARRAARAGLGIRDNLKALGEEFLRDHELEIVPWIGLHTGPAVVEAKEETISLVGEARNVAVRLQDVAEHGQVVCSEATHRLITGHFDCTTRGPRKIKGLTRPVGLFAVQGIAQARSAVEAVAPTALTPLTGRDHEISLLKDRWEQAQEGMGQVVLLTGEPGLGKSRLVYTLKEHVLGQMVEGEVDAPVIEWRCSPHFQNTVLHPAIDFYERALGLGREDPVQTRLERLLLRLKAYGLARPETVPLWASLLSLPTPAGYHEPALSPVRQREETFRIMLDWLQTRSARKPVLFVVEDLHWADASTLEFLAQFLAEGMHDRILTVLTFRPEFQAPWPAPAHQTRLALTHLTRRQVYELMRKKTGKALPDAVVQQIYDRAGGVPLFVEEFTQMVQESTGQGEAGAGILPAHEIPATLQDLVTARLDRMESEREVAQTAAVLGREFNYDLLAAVAPVDESSLQVALAKLSRADILHPKGRAPHCTYIFKHALLEDALYNALVKGARQQLHRRVGEALEAQFPQTVETQPELLGHHFTEASLAEKAVPYWLKAGRRSHERSADREAIGHLTQGLSLLEWVNESPERDRRELEFLTLLGPAYIAARGYAAPEVGPVLHRAGDLCRRIGDDLHLLGIMLGTWEWHIVRGDLRMCVDLAADGMALAQRVNDPGVWMEALFMPGVTKFYRAQFAGARSCFEKAIASYDDRDRTKSWAAYTGHNAGVTHRCYLALTLWQLGFPDQALRMGREACELAREINHPFSLEHAVDFLACLYQFCRLGKETETTGEEELAIANEQGFPLWQALGTLHKAAGMLLQGKRDEALPLLQKGLNAFRATGAGVRVPYYLGMLGDAYTQAGQFDDALGALNEGLTVAEKNDDRFQEAELHRLKGELLLRWQGDEAAAEEAFQIAIETARRQQSKAWELRATMSLARLRQRQGRRDEARDSLAAVYETYTEGFATPDLVDAAALLGRLA